jgi:hypothetical protein
MIESFSVYISKSAISEGVRFVSISIEPIEYHVTDLEVPVQSPCMSKSSYLPIENVLLIIASIIQWFGYGKSHDEWLKQKEFSGMSLLRRFWAHMEERGIDKDKGVEGDPEFRADEEWIGE